MPLRETIDRIRSQPVPPNEESTKVQAVLPTLADLGWDPANPGRVQYEYDVGAKNKRRRVDIALIGKPDVVAFIEVKAPGQKLDDHLDQVLEYAFRIGVDICALTDGLEWWFYLPREKGPPRNRRFEVIDLKSDSTERVAASFESYLLREELLGHRAERRAKEALGSLRNLKELRTVRHPQVWREMRNRPDPELVELVTRRVSAQTRQPQSKSSLFCGAVMGFREIRRLVRPNGSNKDSKPSSPNEERKGNLGRSPTGFRLWGKRHGDDNSSSSSPRRRACSRSARGPIPQGLGAPRQKASLDFIDPDDLRGQRDSRITLFHRCASVCQVN